LRNFFAQSSGQKRKAFVRLKSVTLLQLQNSLLTLSPALIPLLTVPLSFIQSWHCSLMCGPFVATKSPQQKNYYLQGRWLSYTAAGTLFGAVGETLRQALELKVVGAVAFFAFLGLSLVLVSIWLGRGLVKIKAPALSHHSLRLVADRSSFLHGFLSVALPCGLLYQVFGLSILCHSWIGGLLVGSAHATASMPSFWLSSKVMRRFKQFGYRRQLLFKLLLLLLILLNLFFFAGNLLYSEEVARTKILFCL
jgi:sulfite exporter TauE/SafE